MIFMTEVSRYLLNIYFSSWSMLFILDNKTPNQRITFPTFSCSCRASCGVEAKLLRRPLQGCQRAGVPCALPPLLPM